MVSVAVVIPCRNRSDLLPRALASVLAQTRPPEEIIVVDDASTPSVASTITETRDTRLHTVRLNASHGPGHARNVGVEQARSPWIAFLDSDDEWLPHRLETQLNALGLEGDHPADVGYCLVENRGPEPGDRYRPLARLYEADVFRRLVEGHKAGTSTFLIRREVFQAVGGFDTALPSSQDADLLYRLALHGCRFSAVNEALVLWHDHGRQISHNPRLRWRGFRGLDRKWKKPITEHLGALTYQRWKVQRLREIRRLVEGGIKRDVRRGPRGRLIPEAAFWAFLIAYHFPFFAALIVRKRLPASNGAA